MNLPTSPAAERNKQPILEALRALLDSKGAALEIASGTGQHVAFFAQAMPSWQWQPSEGDAQLLPMIDARIAQGGLVNVQPAVQLDVAATPWPLAEQGFDAIFCANMLHISP